MIAKWTKLDRPLTAADIGSYVKELKPNGVIECEGVVVEYRTLKFSMPMVKLNNGFHAYADPNDYQSERFYAWYVREPSGLSLLTKVYNDINNTAAAPSAAG